MPNADGTSAAAAQQKPTKAAAVFSGGMAGISYWFSCYPMVSPQSMPKRNE
jgi:hypothetical protein